MKREIKFRAWDKKRRRLVYEFDGYDFRNHTNDGDNYFLVCSAEKDNGDYYELLLEQFTGLRDKNGKEIYEGDIIKYDGAVLHIIGYVGYLKQCSGFVVVLPKTDKYLSDCLNNCEVIGNIHENPELLEG